MQPVLVDGRKLVPQPPIEIFDDLGVALHAMLHAPKRRCAASCHQIEIIVNSRLAGILAVFTGAFGACEGLIHDSADRRSAAPTLRAASEAAVNLPGFAHALGSDRGADIVVA
jgi:hypothetical protein